MKTHHTLAAVLLCAALSFTSFASENSTRMPEPVLNIKIVAGKAQDQSPKRRSLPLLPPTPAKDAVLLTAEDAIEFAYDPADPLFNKTEFTWVLRARFAKTSFPNLYTPVMGQWVFADDSRSAALLLEPAGKVLFALSADGTNANIKGITAEKPTDTKWSVIVARWQIDKLVLLSIYDDKGVKVETGKISKQNLPVQLKATEHPFLIGAPKKYGMELKSAQVYQSWLTDEQVASIIRAL